MLRFNLPLQHLRQWYHRHQHQNPANNRQQNLTSNSHPNPTNSLRLHASSQSQFAGLQLANQNQENSSPRFRNRTGYPNLFDRLTPKQ